MEKKPQKTVSTTFMAEVLIQVDRTTSRGSFVLFLFYVNVKEDRRNVHQSQTKARYRYDRVFIR